MAKFRVMVTNYGFADIEAESESAALRQVDFMDESDFDWSKDFTSDDAEIVEEIDE